MHGSVDSILVRAIGEGACGPSIDRERLVGLSYNTADGDLNIASPSSWIMTYSLTVV